MECLASPRGGLIYAVVRDNTEHKNTQAKTQYLAFYDHLTELPNRQLLLDRLKHALVLSSRNGRQCGLLFTDPDNLKNLNDTLGHNMGDMLLKQVADCLKHCIREGDAVARLGGDEFVAMLLDLTDKH